MRPVFKYIFCGLVLAALIFIALCVFYIANTYAINAKNKEKPVFPYHTASYFANLSTHEVREIENISPSLPLDGETTVESSDGSFPHFEPSEASPDFEPEPEIIISNHTFEDYTSDESYEDYENEYFEDEHEFDEFDESFEISEYSDEYYTEIDLLYSILETMKMNQYIALFVLAVSLIILIFKPIDKSFF